MKVYGGKLSFNALISIFGGSDTSPWRNANSRLANTAEDLLTRIINTGWRHCTVY